MTLVLFFFAVVLAAAAVWFLARPMGNTLHAETREQHHQLLGVRDRLLSQLNELDIDERDCSMEKHVAAVERARLETELAQTLKQLHATAPDASREKEGHVRSKRLWRRVVVTLALIVPSMSVGLYLLNATVLPTELEQAASMPAPVRAGAPDPLQMVARLEQRLQQNPQDMSGWLMLGRSYAVLQRLDDAKTAYGRAYQLLPKDFQPDSAEQYWFLGLAAYERSETPRALKWWQQLLDAMPPDSEAARQLQGVIEKARARRAKK